MNKILAFLLILILFFAIIPTVRAASASLYLSPSRGNFTVGSTFTVSVYLDTEGNEINVVQADLKFPPDKLQVTAPTTGSSFVSEWLTPPSYSNTQGIISFKGGVLGGIITSSGLVSSITFRAVAPGLAKIKFLEGSKVLLHDGKGTNILVTRVNGEYNIVIPLPEGPRVFSSTHLGPNTWYSDANPAFNWEKEVGATDYSWTFDQNPKGIPDGISEGKTTFTSFSEIVDGIWYFHLRQKKRGVWGGTSHVAVRIDITPPDDFKPRVETYTRLIGYQTMVYFETADNFSGIDHYEVSITDLNVPESSPSFFTEQVSPYKVPFKKAGKYGIIVRAIDEAGNIRGGEARFRIMTPLITHIEGKGIKIKGTLLSWGVIWVLIFVFLVVLGVIVYFLYKKLLKRKRRPWLKG